MEMKPHASCGQHTQRAFEHPTVFWKNLGVTSKQGQPILVDICGQLRPGQLMGIIGPCGAGQTTLLDVLSNRQLRGGARAHGTLLLEGNEAASLAPAVINGLVRYCQLFEHLPENMKVIEALTFCIAMRYPTSGLAGARAHAADHAAKFHLADILQKNIHVLRCAQKKRIAVAIEMIQPSTLNIFDEPFSGLDSHTTLQLFGSIRNMLCINQVAGVITLQTVPPQVSESLDVVMVLYDGHQVFFGTHTQMALYCDTTLGKPTPHGWTTSEFFLYLVNERESTSPGFASERFASSEEKTKVLENEPGFRSSVACTRAPRKKQLVLLARREVMQQASIVFSSIEALPCVLIALVVGWLFLGVASSPTPSDLRETVSLCFYTTTLWTFVPLYSTIVRMRQRLQQIDGELKKGLFSIGPFVVAMTGADLLLFSVWPAIYAAIVFSMADCGRTLAALATMVLLVILCAVGNQTLGVVISVLIPGISAQMAVATAFAQTTFVAGGFYRPASASWYGSVSLMTYAFRGLLRVELFWRDAYHCHGSIQGDTGAGRPSCYIETSGIVDDLRLRGIEVGKLPVEPSPTLDIAVLLGFIFFCRCFVYIALKIRFKLSHTVWQKKELLSKV
jgi:ABC-type multidrug transport system ATPase subunit